MTGTCVNAIKLIGVSSVGLLGGSLAYQSIEVIPKLLDELSNQVSNKNWYLIKYGKWVNQALFGLSSTCFYLSYKYSPVSEKHPYLIYSLLGAGLSFAYTYIKSGSQEKKLRSFKVPKPTKRDVVTEQPQQQPESTEDDLGKSYIHVSDEDSTSAASTPPQSVPTSPKLGTSTGDVEDEINLSLFKKEMVKNYVDLKSTYLIGAGSFGFTFLLGTIGIIGDFLLT